MWPVNIKAKIPTWIGAKGYLHIVKLFDKSVWKQHLICHMQRLTKNTGLTVKVHTKSHHLSLLLILSIYLSTVFTKTADLLSSLYYSNGQVDVKLQHRQDFSCYLHSLKGSLSSIYWRTDNPINPVGTRNLRVNMIFFNPKRRWGHLASSPSCSCITHLHEASLQSCYRTTLTETSIQTEKQYCKILVPKVMLDLARLSCQKPFREFSCHKISQGESTLYCIFVW